MSLVFADARASRQDWIPRLAIAGICLPFLYSALAKLADFNAAAAELGGLGFPAPALFAALTLAFQALASIVVVAMSGRPAALASLALAAFTIAATLIAHAFWKFEGAARVQQANIFVEHLSIAFGLSFIAWWNTRRPRR
jgi:uncharacterized membrane protein YphA (DoxX/SURF4 family)